MRLNLSQRGKMNNIPSGGFKVSQGGVQDLDAVRTQDLASGNGSIPLLSPNTTVPIEYIRRSDVAYQVQLDGPLSGYQHTELKYEITNFGFDKELTCSSVDGDVRVERDEVIFTPRKVGLVSFVVNQRTFTVESVPARVKAPTILFASHVNTEVKVTPFETENVTDTQKSLMVEVYNDPEMTDLRLVGETTTPGATSYAFGVSLPQGTFYVRARYQGHILGYGFWSDASPVTTPSETPGSAPGSRYGESVAISGQAERLIVGSPGVNEGSGGISILRTTSTTPRAYSEEAAFYPINQPTAIKMTIPNGGSIRVVLDSEPPFDRTFTANTTLNLPEWKSEGKLIGKGAPGTRTWVPGEPIYGYRWGDPVKTYFTIGTATAFTKNKFPTDPPTGPGETFEGFEITFISGDLNQGFYNHQYYLWTAEAYIVGYTDGYYVNHKGESSVAEITGALYTFTGGEGTIPAVSSTKTIFANDGDGFGKAVDICFNGTKVLVGAPGDHFNDQVKAGAVYTAKWDGTGWGHLKRLESRALFANHALGTSLASSQDGTYAFAGAPGGGYVAIFKNDTHVTNLTFAGAGEPSAEFGAWVRCSKDGKTLAVGAPGYSHNGAKGVIIIFKEVNGVWDSGRVIQPILSPKFIPLKEGNDTSTYELRVSWKNAKEGNAPDGTVNVAENQSAEFPLTAASIVSKEISLLGFGGSSMFPNPPLNNDAYLLGSNANFNTERFITSMWEVTTDFLFTVHNDIFRKMEGFGRHFALSGDGLTLEAGCYDAGPGSSLLSKKPTEKAVVWIFDLTVYDGTSVKGLSVDTHVAPTAFRAVSNRSVKFHPVLQRSDLSVRAGTIGTEGAGGEMSFYNGSSQTTIIDPKKGNDFAWHLVSSDRIPGINRGVWVVSDPSYDNAKGKIWING